MSSVLYAHLAVSDVHSQVDVTEAPAPDLPHQPILAADLEFCFTATPAA